MKRSPEKQMEFIVETLKDVAVLQAHTARQNHSLRSIVSRGMKMLAELSASQKKTAAAVRHLAASRNR